MTFLNDTHNSREVIEKWQNIIKYGINAGRNLRGELEGIYFKQIYQTDTGHINEIQRIEDGMPL